MRLLFIVGKLGAAFQAEFRLHPIRLGAAFYASLHKTVLLSDVML
jgi:hypothetical protein